MEVPGIVSLIAVLIGGVLLGIVGALVAIPVAAAIRLLLNEILFHGSTRAERRSLPSLRRNRAPVNPLVIRYFRSDKLGLGWRVSGYDPADTRPFLPGRNRE